MPTTACFDAVYAVPAAEPRRPASLATFTIDPAPRSSMPGSTAFMSLNEPVTLTAKTFSHSAGSISWIEPSKSNRGPAAGPANRRALIAAGRELFAEQGFGVPFSQIAKRAGVGQASLYRHFPDKTALAVAVFDENLAAVEAQAHDLRGLLELVVAQARMSASLLEALAPSADPAVAALAQRLERIIAGILGREHEAGRVDPSVTVEDVATAVSMAAFHTAFAPEGRPDAGRAAIALIERALAP